MFKNIFRKKEMINHEEALADWEKNGRPVPPPHIVKQRTIEEFTKKFHTAILVETGTFLGEMVEAQRGNFQKIYSIELSEKLFLKAKKRFRDHPHIKILYGDSGIVLSKVMPEIEKPALFWLDGHYSEGITAKGTKNCPVPEELEIILKSPLPHVILIDDARLFNGTNDYPTVGQIEEIVRSNNRRYFIETKNDIIQLTPSYT
jgi:hypothetical protein